MNDYYREQERLYSKYPYGDESTDMDSQYDSFINGKQGVSRGKGFLAESHSFFDRVKSKLNLFRGYDSHEYSVDQDSAVERQNQLWNAIKRKPIQLVVNDSIDNSHVKNNRQTDPILESANTFLTDNPNDNYSVSTNSPKKKDALSGVPLTGSPFAGSGVSDFMGLDNDALLSSSSPWDRLTAKSTLRKSTTLNTIQKRLLQVSAKKSEVSRCYQKLLKELNEWWQDTIEAEENMALISDLQRMFHEDLVFEQRLADKLKEVSKALEFTKMREEEVLQERKELQHTIKKYSQMRAKKGCHSEEALFLKEKVATKQNSLTVITGHYQQSLSTTARELFVNASVEYFETATDIKDTSKSFFQNSIEYLRTIQAANIEQHIEDLRRKRADKHWSKLTPQERDDPNRLVELMSGMYNGQDSLMRCVAKGGVQLKNSSKLATANKENMPRQENQQDLKLEFRTGLEDSLSEFPSETLNRTNARPNSSKGMDKAKIRPKRNVQVSSLDSHRTLRCEGALARDSELPSRLPYPETSDTLRAHNPKFSFDNYTSPTKDPRSTLAQSDDGTLIRFHPGNDGFSKFAYEPEQDLDRNKWLESPRV